MKQLLSLITLDYKKTIKENRRKLETEENATKLAELQGELSGCKLFMELFQKDFSSMLYDVLLPEDMVKLPDFARIRDKAISRLEAQRIELEKSHDWEELLLKIDGYRTDKKDWLFFSAEKGRDLVFTHSWRDALKKHKEICNTIEREYDFRTSENTLFPDDLQLSNEEIDIVDLTTEVLEDVK